MADRDIAMYERKVYSIYDEIDEVRTSKDEETGEGKCDMCTGRKVLVLAVVALLCIVAALTVALVIVLTQSSGPAQLRFAGEATTPESDITMCPANMEYGNCSRCIATCADPSSADDCTNDCTDTPQTCICPADYLMNGPNCVPKERCGCHRHGYVDGVIAESTTQVAPDCSEECTCTSGTLTCVTTTCAQDAMCRAVDDVRDCFCNDGYEGDGRTCMETPPHDCYDIRQKSSGSATSGDYTISPLGWTVEAFTVNCNMTIDGGGWTVIQRHHQGLSREDFGQNWTAYRNGFGTPSQDFWIGNEKLSHLTNQRIYELRIDMVNGVKDSYYAKYDFFRISGEPDKYRLSGLGNFTGTTGYDALRAPSISAGRSLDMYFSTPDRDSDRYSGWFPSLCSSAGSCAACYRGGWWYNNCYHFNPNYGIGYPHCKDYCVGYWHNLPGVKSLIYTEMKIRPRVATG